MKSKLVIPFLLVAGLAYFLGVKITQSKYDKHYIPEYSTAKLDSTIVELQCALDSALYINSKIIKMIQNEKTTIDSLYRIDDNDSLIQSIIKQYNLLQE